MRTLSGLKVLVIASGVVGMQSLTANDRRDQFSGLVLNYELFLLRSLQHYGRAIESRSESWLKKPIPRNRGVMIAVVIRTTTKRLA